MKAQAIIEGTEHDATSERESHSWDHFNDIMIRGEIVDIYEHMIVDTQPVYLFTWSPDPELLPDSDFITQHKYNVNFLADYLKTCLVGLVCVESTQKGNPHYHGWYQVDPITEIERISYIKTMEKFGLVKITECISMRKGLWSERRNGLHYYKKNLLDEMLAVPYNPITPDSCDDTDWNCCLFFFTKQLKDKRLDKKISDRQYYLKFYRDSNS